MADEDLKNLTPEEKLKKLKELEKKKKKEIAEAQKLIKESEADITDKKEYEEKVPIPETAKEDLEGLSKEAKEILKVQKELKEKKKDDEEEEKSIEKTLDSSGEDLETLARERVDLPPEVVNSEYALQLSQEPMKNIYNEMKDINQTVEEKGYVSKEEERRIEYLTSAVERKIEAEETGSYSFTEDVAMAANMTKQLGASLMNVYKSGNSLYKS